MRMFIVLVQDFPTSRGISVMKQEGSIHDFGQQFWLMEHYPVESSDCFIKITSIHFNEACLERTPQ